MPWHQEAKKDVVTCDKPRLAGSKLTRGSPNGETPPGKPGRSPAECIGRGSQRGELKHLSTPRNRKQTAIPLVAASERGTAQTMRMLKAASVVRVGLRDVSSGPCGPPGRLQIRRLAEDRWTRGAEEGDSPVGERRADLLDMFPSIAGHVKPRVNPGGPSPKAKYYLVTDSELVP